MVIVTSKMTNVIFIAVCLSVWCALTGIYCFENAHSNQTAKADKRTIHRLSRTERNRRLIPYATYYIAGHLNNGNSIATISPSQQPDDDQDTTSAPKAPVKSGSQKLPYKAENEYNYDYQDNNEYSYIPIAYIPGGRSISYNPEAHYYPNSYYQTPVPTETAAKYYTTVKPKYSTTTVTNVDKKFPFSYLTEYVSQQQNNDYYKYLVTPATLKHQVDYEIKKPTYRPEISATTPKSQYLNFRYNLYKTQTPNYDVTTPSTVEITSPRHYLANKIVSSTPYPDASHVSHVTTPYSVSYDYSEQSYTKLPPKKTQELVTQSTKTQMTITKSQELPYQRIPTRVQFVPKPYLVPDFVPSQESSVDDILNGYNINKQLPDKITADNIKQSIHTLSYILQVLQKADSLAYYQKPTQFSSKEIFDNLKSTHSITPIEHNSVSPLQPIDDGYDTYDKEPTIPLLPNKPFKDEQSTAGRAGIDYPIMSVIPETNFDCKTQRYKGFFADPETRCQVWHYCDLNGGQASFLCPNGTIFNQAALTCDWWFNVKCAATPQLYVLNERLYKYIIPVRPSFPEDFSGPLVDQYLTEKFKETESKRKYRYPTNSTTNKNETDTMTALNEYEIPSHLLSENL